MFSAFIVRNADLALENGRLGFMSPYVWMFISAYEKLRIFLIEQKTITSLIQLEYNASGEVRVPLCTFTLQNKHFSNYRGTYIRLTDFPGYNIQAKKAYEAINNPTCSWRYLSSSNNFKKIPGSPISYTLSEQFRDAFIQNPSLHTIMPFKRGMATGDNSKFLRYWHELSFQKTSCGSPNSASKWQPYNKGGNYRKWYGNREYVINWEQDGYYIKNFKDKNGRLKSRPQNIEHNYKPAISYSSLTSGKPSMRFYKGFIHDQAGNFLPKKEPDIIPLLSYLNSVVALNFLILLSPTLNTLTDDLNRLPVPENWQNYDKENTKKLLEIHKKDWDFFETSWDFNNLPILNLDTHNSSLFLSYNCLRANWNDLILAAQQHEVANNRIFIEAFGLQDKLTPDVPLEEITLTCNPYYRYGGNKSEKELEAQLQTDTIKELISYALGCMMGRYSLDEPGLIYAREGNIGFDPERYVKIQIV